MLWRILCNVCKKMANVRTIKLLMYIYLFKALSKQYVPYFHDQRLFRELLLLRQHSTFGIHTLQQIYQLSMLWGTVYQVSKSK